MLLHFPFLFFGAENETRTRHLQFGKLMLYRMSYFRMEGKCRHLTPITKAYICNMADWKKLRIIFMGTPDFAVASLDALISSGAHVVAVVTGADKPAGRGMKLRQSAVKEYALAHGLPVLQPEKLRDPVFLDALSGYDADIQIVVAFRMLPEIVWNMPALGTINLHGSLLPQYRGAAPINWAVINGDTETGVTTFKLQHAIDTGNMLLQEKMTIGPDDTAGDIHDKMMLLGAQTLVKTVQQLAEGTLKEIPQSEPHNLKAAPKIFTETCLIDWNQSTDHIHNLIRGLSPFPGAFTQVNGKIFKIFKSKKEHTIPTEKPGTILSDNKNFIKFATADGYIQALEIQPEGKKRMPPDAYLRGHHIG